MKVSFRSLGWAGAGLILLTAPSIAPAELLCTMPSGVTVTRQIGDCPRDALVVRKPGGEVVRTSPPPAPPKQKAVKPAPPPPVAAHAAASTAPQPTTYDFADLICKAFRQSGASECLVNSSMFATNYIEVTLAMPPYQALIACEDVAASIHQKTNAFAQRSWGIKIFSPFSGNRPIAACDL